MKKKYVGWENVDILYGQTDIPSAVIAVDASPVSDEINFYRIRVITV